MRLKTGMVVLAALAALACSPAAGDAAQQVITSPGPLSSIAITNGLACQAHVGGDITTSFYGEIGVEAGSCGTFLALAEGEDVAGGTHLFGPTVSRGAAAVEAEFTPIAQTLAGADSIVTNDYATEKPRSGAVNLAHVVETDSYVPGEDSFQTTITITNLGASELKGTLYHVGDCYLAESNEGYGAANVPSTGSVACTSTPDDSPPARYMAFTPIATEGFPVSSASFVESEWPSFWKDIEPTGKQLPDQLAATTFVDNGMGLSWPLKLAPEASATLELTTTIVPPSPPVSTTSASACQPSGQVPITVSAEKGPRAVRYRVDGGAVQTAETSAAGQATIGLTAGQHTLEYWGEDENEVQESPHHTLSVLAASPAPTLTISSDEGRASYEVGETASVTIAASGAGLTSDPTKIGEPISTSTPGTYTLSRSATNACGTTAASFTWSVLPPPALGKTVNVVPVSGKVLVALPSTAAASIATPLQTAFESLSKGLKFIPLTEARQVPVGSTLETTAGVARITTATSTVGKTQSGEFGAGIFKLLQNRKQKGLTELNIVDNRSSKQVCATVGKKAAVAAKLSSKTLGRLTGSAHGKFTTKGQYSAATVRGTSWGVTNQCDGTLTKVSRGEVSVRDFHRRKTITLFSGQSYLAKAPL